MAVKSEEEEVGDPRIHKMYDPRIQRMYREDLPEDREESESTDSPDDSSSERRRGDYEELIKEFPEAMELVEEERKERERERERGHMEKQLRSEKRQDR